MKRHRAVPLLLLIVGLTFLSSALPVAAQEKIFLKVEGVPGSSEDPSHDGWIEVIGLSHGANRPDSGGGGGLPPPVFTDITVLKVTDATSPELNFIGVRGEPIQEVLVDVCRLGQSQQFLCYYKLTLKNVRITALDVAASSCVDPTTCGGIPTNVTFTFDEIVWTYTAYDDQGNQGNSSSATYKHSTGEGG